MQKAARTARRKGSVPYRRNPLRRGSPTSVASSLREFLPPLVAGVVLLVLYILGLLDVIPTRPALAIDAFLLLAMVLFFPMRYALRLPAPRRVLAALLAIAWLAVIYYPVYRRIYPGERLFTTDAQVERLPITLPTKGLERFDLLINGHLDNPEHGGTRVARYAVTLAGQTTPPQVFEGEFKETWQRQRQGRGQDVEVLRERSARTVVVDNPYRENLDVTAVRVDGHADPVLTLSLYPHLLPRWWVTVLLGAALLSGAVWFDRATGAGDTAASMVIATAATFVGAYTFPSIGSPQPTFRELAGAAVVGALVGGPIGGLVAWSTRRGGASSLALSARAR